MDCGMQNSSKEGGQFGETYGIGWCGKGGRGLRWNEYIVSDSVPQLFLWVVQERVMPAVVVNGNLECFMDNHQRESGYLF